MKKILVLLIIVMVGKTNYAANDTIYHFDQSKNVIEATVISEQIIRSVPTDTALNLSKLTNAELSVLVNGGLVKTNVEEMYLPKKILGDTRYSIFYSFDNYIMLGGKIIKHSVWEVSKDERKYILGFILMLAPTFLILFPWFFRKGYGDTKDNDKRKWRTIIFGILIIFTATLIIPRGMLTYPLLSGGQEQLGIINGVFAIILILILCWRWLPENSILPILAGLGLPGFIIIVSSAFVTKALIIMQGTALTEKEILLSSEFVIIWEYLFMLLGVTVISYTVQKMVLRYHRRNPIPVG